MLSNRNCHACLILLTTTMSSTRMPWGAKLFIYHPQLSNVSPANPVWQTHQGAHRKGLQQAVKESITQIQASIALLEEARHTIVTRCLSDNIMSLRQMSKLLEVSPATVSRQYRTNVQAPRLTSGRHLTDTELARTVASFYDWSLGDSTELIDLKGKQIGQIGHDITQTAAAMRELGWFYDPLIASIGVQWSIMPGQDDEAKASQMIRNLLHCGMYWMYDSNGEPVVRMRDGRRLEEVRNDFKTLPQYAAYRSH